jgi:carboxyl-terminal processing protease
MSAFTLKPTAANETVTRTTLTRDFRNAMDLIRAKYVEQVEYQALTKASIQGMLEVLDPHSDYFDRKAFAEMNSEQRSHYFGIGAQIAPRYRGTYILETFEGTPAARAGLRYGDHIIAVDGTDTSTWTSERVRNLLRGERGTIVRVTVQRPGAAEPIIFPIQRDSVALPSITSYYLARPDIGYINLSRGFHSTTSDELNSIMAELSEKGARSFILDLRGNRGGYLDQAIKVADRFLQRGQVIVSVRGRDSKNFDRDITTEIGATEIIPLVVLINRESASASEIVAGAIQDHDRGLIIGESSFGKGLVQNIFPLSDGSGLTLTIARYYTPSGRLIQRDYSNGLFEYYARRARPDAGAAPTPRPDEKHTDLGRTVFGGGGIEPDIKVENAAPFNPVQSRLYSAVYLFTRELVNGKVAGLEKYKINNITFKPGDKPAPYLISDEVLKSFREFMVKFLTNNTDLGVTIEQVDGEMDWARKTIRQEVLWAAYGFEFMQRMTDENDLQLQRAITELPKSAELAEKSWRATATIRR